MTERARRWLFAVACLLVAGCGSSTVTSISQRPAVHGSRGPAETAAQRCALAARLSPGVAFPDWHMGAVHFLSAGSAVGLTAESFPCFRLVTGGVEVGSQTQSVWLAVTNDGGRSWHVKGAPLPVGSLANGVVVEQLVATSPADLWALVGRGRLMATRDAGSNWQVQHIPNPVVELAADGGFVWALSCPPAALRTSPLACAPQLWRTPFSTERWTRLVLPLTAAQDASYVQLAITADRSAIINLLQARARPPFGLLLISRDDGTRWTTGTVPTWDHNKCDDAAGAILTAAPPRTFWLLCIGNGAAGSSTKGLLRSTDGGHKWETVSAAPSLIHPPGAGSIPLEEPSALAAGSQTRLWLSLTNDLAESNDAGKRWTPVPGVNTVGSASVFDVLDANHAWLLAPGAGLWRTTDGIHWRPVGPLNTG